MHHAHGYFLLAGFCYLREKLTQAGLWCGAIDAEQRAVGAEPEAVWCSRAK